MTIGKLLWNTVRFILWLLMTIIVVPAMIIMMWIHPTWEKWLKEVVTLGF